jgi:hypothetical protein
MAAALHKLQKEPLVETCILYFPYSQIPAFYNAVKTLASVVIVVIIIIFIIIRIENARCMGCHSDMRWCVMKWSLKTAKVYHPKNNRTEAELMLYNLNF